MFGVRAAGLPRGRRAAAAALVTVALAVAGLGCESSTHGAATASIKTGAANGTVDAALQPLVGSWENVGPSASTFCEIGHVLGGDDTVTTTTEQPCPILVEWEMVRHFTIGPDGAAKLVIRFDDPSVEGGDARSGSCTAQASSTSNTLELAGTKCVADGAPLAHPFTVSSMSDSPWRLEGACLYLGGAQFASHSGACKGHRPIEKFGGLQSSIPADS